MGIESKKLWIINGNKYEDHGLCDGNLNLFDGNDHRELCEKFSFENSLPKKCLSSDIDYAKFLSSEGFVVLFASGQMIDHKYYGSWFLPEQLTEKQIETLEIYKSLFEEKFHNQTNLFDCSVYTLQSFPYRLKENCFRDLEIESIINGNPSKNGLTLMYAEIERQKQDYIKK